MLITQNSWISEYVLLRTLYLKITYKICVHWINMSINEDGKLQFCMRVTMFENKEIKKRNLLSKPYNLITEYL